MEIKRNEQINRTYNPGRRVHLGVKYTNKVTYSTDNLKKQMDTYSAVIYSTKQIVITKLLIALLYCPTFI